MCNRVRQPAAEAPDDRGGRAGVREVVGVGVLVCRGCQPRRPSREAAAAVRADLRTTAAGGARAALT